jgi:hypothetical protein
MRRDYRLYELNDDEFEKLVARIGLYWFGQGLTPFAPGKDGGRDAKFDGTALCFPSQTAPWNGKVVLQAKHVAAPDRSCSDPDFKRLLKKEHSKITNLIQDGLCDHYVVFTNRKLTAGADAKLVTSLEALGVKNAYIVGVEKLNLALEHYPDIRETLPNSRDTSPFRFDPNDIVEVIGALHDYAENSSAAFDSARDFESIRIRDEKNKINGLSQRYYQQIVVSDSMPHFARIEEFLKNPRNTAFASLYHDSADELKAKILIARAKFELFDDVFAFLYERIQTQRPALKGKRRLISILLHYMYCNCDIGDKSFTSVTAMAAHVDS